MTKREMFDVIATVCADNQEIVDFCKHEVELLSRKKASASKPTKNQIENVGFKASILEILGEHDAPITISDMMEDSRLAGLKNQRISALITQLRSDGKVVRSEVKGKAFFALA